MPLSKEETTDLSTARHWRHILRMSVKRSNKTVTTPDVQSALDTLRDKGLVVRLERGRYTLDDGSLSEWLADRFPPPEASDERRPK